MKKSLAFVLVLALTLAVGVHAAAPTKQMENWEDMRDDMEMAKGSLKQTAGSTVLNTYIPGYGAVFMFTVPYGKPLEIIQNEIEKVIKYAIASIEKLGDTEKVVLVGYYEGIMDEWEIMYITTKSEVSNPDSWEVYYNKSKK